MYNYRTANLSVLTNGCTFSRLSRTVRVVTRSSAIGEGPRDARCYDEKTVISKCVHFLKKTVQVTLILASLPKVRKPFSRKTFLQHCNNDSMYAGEYVHVDLT